MIEEQLQLWLDQALATSHQRWIMGSTAVVSIAAAATVAGLGHAAVGELLLVVLATAALATLSVAGSGTHTGSIAIAAVALQWLAYVDDVTSPRAIGVALGLYGFHALLSLMAATPHTSIIDHAVLRRWAARSLWMIGATVGVWGFVVAFEGRDTGGGEPLTIAGLVVIGIAVVAARRAVLSSVRHAETGPTGPS